VPALRAQSEPGRCLVRTGDKPVLVRRLVSSEKAMMLSVSFLPLLRPKKIMPPRHTESLWSSVCAVRFYKSRALVANFSNYENWRLFQIGFGNVRIRSATSQLNGISFAIGT